MEFRPCCHVNYSAGGVVFCNVRFYVSLLCWECRFVKAIPCVCFGIFSVLVFQISVLESYLDIYLF